MDDAFSLIAAAAVEAGWKPEEVAAALVELADNHVLALLVNRDLERGLAAWAAARDPSNPDRLASRVRIRLPCPSAA
nr:hypothetical protein [Rhizobium leguminosarum]